ncbi:GntR family transcriptional regulator [uncultured Umboniibacter sp.]|uniref:GntR family transcriptional regulator n=1 Tax=uncultured Umboniibacter sp. TaxID=1798917 RepID=UPI002613D64E|nr:GntR family transcriptional regulator [uncultured Umboniibacter sp.]
MSTERPRFKTQQEAVYFELREAILRGKFQPGNSVTLRGVAEMLDVSLMPVRESLRRLTAERALQLLDNRRIAVPTMSESRLEEIYITRFTLESFAAEKAMANIDAAAMGRLEEINRLHNRAIAERDVENYIYLNFDFHRQIYSYSGLEVILPLIESLWLQIAPFMRMISDRFAQEGDFDESEDKHLEILEAIGKQNATRLKHLIQDDILDGVRIQQEMMGWQVSS